MPTDTQTTAEQIDKPADILDSIHHFAKLEADQRDFRLRKELRSLGFMVALPKDEDE